MIVKGEFIHVTLPKDRVNVLKFHTSVAGKMAYANSAGPDQTAPEGAI